MKELTPWQTKVFNKLDRADLSMSSMFYEYAMATLLYKPDPKATFDERLWDDYRFRGQYNNNSKLVNGEYWGYPNES